MTVADARRRPLVSTIVIFLGGAAFLGEAIESVIAQSYPEWELLLVDDGSTDGASEIARAYASRHDGRIRYLHHDGHRNRGMSASRNLGLQHAKGTIVAFLDGDDVWLPGKLDVQVSLLEAHPAADATCGSTRVWYGWTGRPEDAARDGVRKVLDSPDGLHRPPEMLRRYLRDEALTPATCSVLIRRSALSKTGGFEERFKGMYEDQAFFFKSFLHLAYYVTAESYDSYRQHADSHSAVALRTGRYFLDRPSAAMADLYVWFVRYFVRERVRDLELWKALLVKVRAIGMHWVRKGAHRFMETVDRPTRLVFAVWYRLRHAAQGEQP